MNNKREKRNLLLSSIGFTSKEIQALEELGAKLDLNSIQVLRNAVRTYQLIRNGHAKLVSKYETHGCGNVD